MPRQVDMPATMLTAWHYKSAMGAAAGQIRLKDLQRHGALRVLDAVTVIWVRGAEAPHVGHLMRRSMASVSKASVLGALVGALSRAPMADPASEAGPSAVAHRLHDFGIEGSFLQEIKSRLVPGTSSLLVLSSDVDLGTVRQFVERGVCPSDVTLMAAWLPNVAPDALTGLLGMGLEHVGMGLEHGAGIARSG
jgi:uncharacterized membrane protein